MKTTRKDNDWEPRYSGPKRLGICECDCSWEDHHLGMVMNQEYYEATNEAYVAQECDNYGFNELGGIKYNKKTKEWEDHCYGYRDVGTLGCKCYDGNCLVRGVLVKNWCTKCKEEIMPLNKKGTKIKHAMEKQYGKKKGDSVFYASENKGTIKGVKKHG